MALALYRRHRRDCKAGHSEERRSSEYDERKKGWKRCECSIFISGTLQGTFKRQSTSKWEWDQARSIALHLEQVGSWTGKVTPPAPPRAPEAPRHQSRITTVAAVKVFLSNREGAKIAPSTLRKYRTFTNQLTAFANSPSYVMLAN